MGLFLVARNKLRQAQTAQDGLCAAVWNIPSHPSHVLITLCATIMLFGIGATNFLYAATGNGMAPMPRQVRDDQQLPYSSPVRITRQQTEPIDPLLRDAYLAYRNGRLNEAQLLYLAMFKKDAHNADALLGLAAIALQQGENQIAAQYYSRVLILDPRNALANAGMSALNPDDDGNESRLKILLREQGDCAALHFALGNLYAGQSRWSEAQQAYFNANTLESGNAGFAFNLAVSLDYLGQRNLAARHYQHALQLDQSNSAGFDHGQTLQRISELID